jgi:transposase
LGHILVAFDEVGFELETEFKKIWFMTGEKPKGAFFWSSKKLRVIGALTSDHLFYYEFCTAQNTFTFCCFLLTFIEKLDPVKNYVFLLDNVGYHKTSSVQRILSKYSNHIAVEYLPTYSPELNPIETNWKVTKNSVTKSQYYPSLEDLQKALELFWGSHSFMQNFITYLCP